MDVDIDRTATDDEHMDFDDIGSGSIKDQDGDAVMMEEGEGEEEYEEMMEAEPVETPGLLTGDSAAAFLSPSVISAAPLPSSAGLFSVPLPLVSPVVEVEETEMTPVEDVPGAVSSGNSVIVEGGLLLAETKDTSVLAAPVNPVASLTTPITAPPEVPAGVSGILPLPKSSREQEGAGPSTTPRQPSNQNQPLAEASTTQSITEEPEEEEDYYEEEEEGGDQAEDLIDIHSLPPIILNLPTKSARTLFQPLSEPDEESYPNLPVWLLNRHEELGEASLADVWGAIRSEMIKEGLAKSGELVLVEKQMDLRMGEVSLPFWISVEEMRLTNQDDVNLQSITLLEFLQLHQGCDLPIPVQLHVSFEPSRFITRFQAIQKELETQVARRKSMVVEDVGEENVEGAEEGGEDGEEALEEGFEDGEAGFEDGEEGIGVEEGLDDGAEGAEESVLAGVEGSAENAEDSADAAEVGEDGYEPEEDLIGEEVAGGSQAPDGEDDKTSVLDKAPPHEFDIKPLQPVQTDIQVPQNENSQGEASNKSKSPSPVVHIEVTQVAENETSQGGGSGEKMQPITEDQQEESGPSQIPDKTEGEEEEYEEYDEVEGDDLDQAEVAQEGKEAQASEEVVDGEYDENEGEYDENDVEYEEKEGEYQDEDNEEPEGEEDEEVEQREVGDKGEAGHLNPVASKIPGELASRRSCAQEKLTLALRPKQHSQGK